MPGQPKLYYPSNLLGDLPPFSLEALFADRDASLWFAIAPRYLEWKQVVSIPPSDVKKLYLYSVALLVYKRSWVRIFTRIQPSSYSSLAIPGACSVSMHRQIGRFNQRGFNLCDREQNLQGRRALDWGSDALISNGTSCEIPLFHEPFSLSFNHANAGSRKHKQRPQPRYGRIRHDAIWRRTGRSWVVLEQEDRVWERRNMPRS